LLHFKPKQDGKGQKWGENFSLFRAVFTQPEQENSQKIAKKFKNIKKTCFTSSLNGSRKAQKEGKNFLRLEPFLPDLGFRIPKEIATKNQKTSSWLHFKLKRVRTG